MNSRVADIVLGILFFSTMAGLGIATIVLSDFHFGEERHNVDLLSPDVGYLRAGDPVLVFGMPAGKVVTIERLPEPRVIEMSNGRIVPCAVRVRTSLDVDIYSRLPIDSEFIIEDRGLLGGKLIRVATGTSNRTVERGMVLVAFSTASALQSAGEVLAENRESLRRTLDSLTEMIEHANRGGGLLGALVWDDQLVRDVRGGVERIDGFFETAEAVAQDLRDGKGTLGKLLVDDGVYVEGEGLLADLHAASSKIRSGEGIVGKLIYDDDSAEEFDKVVSGFSNDRTVFGMLLTDEELGDKLRKVISLTLGAIEDARESSPVRSVGSFLFGTF